MSFVRFVVKILSFLSHRIGEGAGEAAGAFAADVRGVGQVKAGFVFQEEAVAGLAGEGVRAEGAGGTFFDAPGAGAA